MSELIDVAVIGSTGPVGEALLQQFADRNFPINQLIPLSFDDNSDDAADSTIEFAGKNIHTQNIAEFNFSRVKLVFLCQADDSYIAIVDRILDANCKLIELGSNLLNAPAIVAGINSDPGIFNENQHIRSASGLAVVLTQLLKQLSDEQGIKALNFTALQSVSEKGKAGIDELAMQTTNLLNTRPINPGVFKKQIAFNVMTDDGDINATGFTSGELDIINELQDLLFSSTGGITSVMPSFIYVPVFYGVSVDIHIELENEIDIGTFEAIISEHANVALNTVDEFITPVSHAAEMDRIFINRLRQDLNHPRQLNFWCVTDTIKSGSAINGVQIGEILVKHHL